MFCHPERSEGSLQFMVFFRLERTAEILLSAQGDSNGFRRTRVTQC